MCKSKAGKTTKNYNQTFVKKEVIFAAFFVSAGLVFFFGDCDFLGDDGGFGFPSSTLDFLCGGDSFLTGGTSQLDVGD